MSTDNRGEFQHLQNYGANYTPRPHQREILQHLANEAQLPWHFPSFDDGHGLQRGVTKFLSGRTGVPNTIDKLHSRMLMQMFHAAQRLMCVSFGIPMKLLYQSTFSGFSRFDDELHTFYSGIVHRYLSAPMVPAPKLTPLMFLRLLRGPSRTFYPTGKSVSMGMMLRAATPLAAMYRYPAPAGLRMEMVKPVMDPLDPRGLPGYHVYDYIDSLSYGYRYTPLILQTEPDVVVLKRKIRGANSRSIAPEVQLRVDIEADYKRWAKRA